MIIQPTVNEYGTLINIWENAVRATHDFLTEEDIQFYKPLILNEYFQQVKLFCHKDSKNQITGFMGIADGNLEMLFIDPRSRGQGLGKALLLHAIEQEKVEHVDVNEQNDQAIGFYKHIGFQVISRSELDGQGKPYPILHMKLTTHAGR
ncbi:MAG: acetyltransferase [Sporomusaceae bacterium]|nr:acetyltransferase [Sporomusaceae bacterium]